MRSTAEAGIALTSAPPSLPPLVDDATAVDQDQGALRAEAAQVDGRGAGAAAVVHLRIGGSAGDVGQFLHQVADGQLAGLLDRLAVDGHDRAGVFGIDAADARAGDLNAVQGLGLVGVGARRVAAASCANATPVPARVVTPTASAREIASRSLVVFRVISLQVSLGVSHGNLTERVKEDAKYGQAGADSSRLRREIKVPLNGDRNPYRTSTCFCDSGHRSCS